MFAADITTRHSDHLSSHYYGKNLADYLSVPEEMRNIIAFKEDQLPSIKSGITESHYQSRKKVVLTFTKPRWTSGDDRIFVEVLIG